MGARKKWEDKENIYAYLSFNQVKIILRIFRQYQPSSPEGQICVKLLKCLRTYLEREANNGNLPPGIAGQLLSKGNGGSSPSKKTN